MEFHTDIYFLKILLRNASSDIIFTCWPIIHVVEALKKFVKINQVT